jgi:predicted GIY-YIG superfamily endonuclease
MWYVYIIRSIYFPEHEYVGATAALKRRIPEHNAGKSAHTAKFKPRVSNNQRLQRRKRTRAGDAIIQPTGHQKREPAAFASKLL